MIWQRVNSELSGLMTWIHFCCCGVITWFKVGLNIMWLPNETMHRTAQSIRSINNKRVLAKRSS